MTLRKPTAPFVKRESTVATMMADAIVALTVLLVLPVYYHGFRPVVLALCAIGAALVCELLFGLIQAKKILIREPSCVVTALIITMLMPLNAPLWLPAAAAAFAILAAKAPFGSLGNNPFNPAAAGVAFVTVCWPGLMFGYPDPLLAGKLPLFANVSAPQVLSPAGVLKQGLKPDLQPLQLLWGNVAGPLGAVGVLVVGACGLYLFFKRTARWETTVCFLLAAAVIAAVSPRIACSALTSVKYELLSGSLLFCAVFMATDPVTSPRTFPARCLYGALAGALTMLFRYFGAYEQGACFALLIANAASPVLDRAVCGIRIRGGAAA